MRLLMASRGALAGAWSDGGGGGWGLGFGAVGYWDVGGFMVWAENTGLGLLG